MVSGVVFSEALYRFRQAFLEILRFPGWWGQWINSSKLLDNQYSALLIACPIGAFPPRVCVPSIAFFTG